MRNFRKDAKIGVIMLAAAFVVAQAFRIEKTNPPVTSEIQAHASVKTLLKRACYDCHSNETVWPWYSNVAPVSWMVANDVNGGREHLNFSEWGEYDSRDRERKMEEIVEETGEGKMPLWYYSIAHPESRLESDDLSLLRSWAAATMDAAEPKY